MLLWDFLCIFPPIVSPSNFSSFTDKHTLEWGKKYYYLIRTFLTIFLKLKWYGVFLKFKPHLLVAGSKNLPTEQVSIFGVYLVKNVEPNLMQRILIFLIRVWWVELGGTDSFSNILRLPTWFWQRTHRLNVLSIRVNLSRNCKIQRSYNLSLI